MCSIMNIILAIMVAMPVQCLAWNDSLSSCTETSNSLAGTAYATAVHYWPLKSSSSLIDVIKCQTALDVYGVISTLSSPDGLYGISTGGSSGIKLASLSDPCLKNVSLCQNGLSISLWIKLSGQSFSPSNTFDVILTSENTAGNNMGILIYDHYDKGLQVSIRTKNSTLTKPITVQRNVWYHVTIMWTHYEGIVHYINGNMFPSNGTTVQNSSESSADQTADLYLSCSTKAGKAVASYRDLAIWNYRLSEEQVQAIYQHTPGCQEIPHKEWKMTASSFSDHYIPDNGYFYSHSAWCADPKVTNGYLQIELPDLYKVHSLVLQGKENGTKEHVKTFQVKFSINAINWETSQTLNGPSTADQQKLIVFENPPIFARYFRIYPLTSSGRSCLRARLCGEKRAYLNITASVEHSKVNGQRSCKCSIKVNNQEHCPDKPGHNIVAISHKTGELVEANSFDTSDNANINAGILLTQFINSLPDGALVIVAVKDSGHRISKNDSTALYNIGSKSTNPPPVKTAWILLGSKGVLHKFIEEKKASSEHGLLELQKLIPVEYGLKTSHFWPLSKTDYRTAHGNPKRPWYYKYFRDIVGGLDLYHNAGNVSPMMRTVRVSDGNYVYSKTMDVCLFRPTKCPGGITVSLWLKAEHTELFEGEKDTPRYPLHKAYFVLSSHPSNGHITVNSKTYTSSNTGHFVVLVDYATGQVKEKETFDVLNDVTAEDRFTSFLNNTPNGTIVLVAVKTSSKVTSPALVEALKNIGAQDPAISSNNRYILYGYKGLDRQDWIEEIKWQHNSISLSKKIPIFGAWTSETETDNIAINVTSFSDFLQIQLPQAVLISGIITQGASSEPAWVTSYRIDYSIDGQLWMSVKDGSVVTEFTGNTDQHTKVTHTFRRPFNARLLKIIPLKFISKIIMRISVLQINNAHPWLNHQPWPNKLVIPAGPKAMAFGKENFSSSIKSSGNDRGAKYRPLFAALHSTETSVSKGCWCPGDLNNDFRVRIEFKEKVLVTGIAIQGSPSSDEWTTKFELNYKDGGFVWYKEKGSKKTFIGSHDRHTVVFHSLKELLYTKILKIYSKSWHQYPCFRFEVYGYPMDTTCFGPLGVDERLPDNRFSASSSHSAPYSAEKARIGPNHNAAWCVALYTQPEYLQVDLGEPTIFTGIATQGLVGFFWTKRFYLAYSQEGLRWMNHTWDDDLRIMDGNTDGTSVVVSPINPSIESRFIRVYPLEASSSNGICLKIELFGCFKADNPSFALVGPLEINAPISSVVNITGSYRYCEHAISCPGCTRQIYVEVFDEVKCVVPAVLYDCQYHQFDVTYSVPLTPQVYNIRMFDVIGEACISSMTRNVSGKIVGRVLAKLFSSTTCLDVLLKGNKKNGIYNIQALPNAPAMPLYCDQMSHGGGWTVIQRRINGTVDFYRTWDEYKHGFGDLEGEFWIGNDNLHLMTSSPVELLIEMEKFSGHYYFAKYDTFAIASEQANYKLSVGGYSGTAGDSFLFHNGAVFSTKDKNNDPGNINCTTKFQGGWWYKQCKDADLNNIYDAQSSGTNWKGIKWEKLLGTSGNLKAVEMKIRLKEESSISCSETECFYLLKNQKQNFLNSHKACMKIGAELASITSSDQTTKIADMLSKASVQNAYIGLNDISIEGTSVWADGTNSPYTNIWKNNNDASKDCVVVCQTGQRWCFVRCNWEYNPLCKRTGLMCHKGYCYKAGSSSMTSSNAKKACEQYGMTLMKLATEDQIRYVTKKVMAETATNVWMSLNDVDNEGKFKWHDQSHLTNPNWAVLEPKNLNNNEDCTTLTPDGRFKAIPCTENAGQACQKPRVVSSCLELLELGETKNGVYYIHPDTSPAPVKVYCDQEQDGGGWEVFFRRQDGSVKFHNKLWNDFKYGFGDLENEFWLGLKHLTRLPGTKELMLKIKNSIGQTRYIRYLYFNILPETNKFEARIGWHRGGNIGGEIGRIANMRFSTIDQDNDHKVNVSCAETHGPGWLWTYMHHDKRDCFNPGYNLFGPYSPNAIGNESLNLFYNNVGHPITYIEMKTRDRLGNSRSVIGTATPMDGLTWEGFSLQYIPHQFTFHLSTTDKAWFLAISPSAYWSYYTFSWSEQNGIRSYENSMLVMQDKEFRSVGSSYRNRFYLVLSEIQTTNQMFRFMTRMKAWNRDLTANQINADFNEATFTLEGDVTHWDKADDNPYNWTTNSNCTKSSDTGPCLDHTYGFPQGSYYYLEASYPTQQHDSASLISPVFFPKYHKCFSFWYYMDGEEMGDLVVKIKTYSRTAYTLTVAETETTILKRSGNKGKRWKLAVLKLNSNNLFSLNITGIVGQGYKSDIAIDDLSVSMSECPAGLTDIHCYPPCNEGFACLDDKGECDCKGLKYVNSTCYDVLKSTIFHKASHYWPLDAISNVTNLLGFTHGKTTGGVTSVPGPVNQALVTHGSTGQIVLGDLSTSCILTSPSCTNGFTFWFWLKFPKNEARERKVYLSVGQDEERSRGLQVLQDFSVIDNPAHLIINTTIEGTTCVAAFEAHAAIWSVIAVTWGTTNGLTIYHNGKNVTKYQLHTCSSVASVFPSNSLLRTGFGEISPELTIDDTVIWHRELDATEIIKIFRFFTAPQKTLLLSVKFPDEVFQDRLRDRESQEFKDFHNKILGNIQAIFNGKSINFDDIFINHLSNGSVNARLSLFFHDITSKELDILNNAVCHKQALNNMAIKPLGNIGIVFMNHTDIRQKTICQSTPLIDTDYGYIVQSPSCNMTRNLVTVL